jgi:hypothetical protein
MFKHLAVFIIIILILSIVSIFDSPLELIENSSASETRADKDDENTTSSNQNANITHKDRRDTDKDGLKDDEEMEIGTDVSDEDTDDDGVNDKDDYYPLNPSLWRSPLNIFLQVAFELTLILIFFISYIAYLQLKRKKERQEKKD